MRRSVLFFTLVIAAIGCGSSSANPSNVSEPDEEQNPSDPAVRPPTAIEMDQVARIDEGRAAAADQKIAARTSSDRDRDVIQAPAETPYEAYFSSPPRCAGVFGRRVANP
jgi:hypothetical protein